MARDEVGQAELARRLTKAGIKCTRSAVSRWLAPPDRDPRDPSPEALAAICRLLGLSADEVLGLPRARVGLPKPQLVELAGYLEAARQLVGDHVTDDERETVADEAAALVARLRNRNRRHGAG